MYMVEIFKKRRTFEPLFRRLWERIKPELVFPVIAEEDPQQKLVYVGLLAYAAAYNAATAAEMSSSAAHYLARMQMRQYKFDKPTGKAIERIFSGTEDTVELEYAQRLGEVMQQIIAMEEPDAPAVHSLMQNLAESYAPVSV